MEMHIITLISPIMSEEFYIMHYIREQSVFGACLLSSN